jgi:sRNA-binding protein
MQPRTPLPNRLTLALLAAGFVLGMTSLAMPLPASAQQKKKEKKLYCWDEGGQRICSDALPASAVGNQRTEFDQKTGTAVKRVARELTPEERERAEQEAEAQKIEAQRNLREMAMVASYETEEDLQRAFSDRFELVEESLKGSAMALTNLHNSLISLLRQANELELQSKPVGKVLHNKILNQHAELQALRALKKRQQAEREILSSEFQEALSRYRALKEAPNGGGATAGATPPPPNRG